MYMPNLKQIGRKTRPQWPKKPPKFTFFRHNVATLLRHDVKSHAEFISYTLEKTKGKTYAGMYIFKEGGQLTLRR